MVAARRGDFERAAGGLLPSNRAEVTFWFPIQNRAQRGGFSRDVGERRLSAQPANDRADVRRAMHRHPFDEHRLLPVPLRDDRVLKPCLARASQQGEHAAHRPQLPGQRQLADQQRARELLGRDALAGRQDRRRDREVEPSACFGEVTRREVQHQMPRRKREADGRQGGAHPDAALPNPALRKPDDVEAWKTFAEAHLDLNRIGFDSDEARGMRSGEHAHVRSTGRARGRAKNFADLHAAR